MNKVSVKVPAKISAKDCGELLLARVEALEVEVKKLSPKFQAVPMPK